MVDEAASRGIEVDAAALERELGPACRNLPITPLDMIWIIMCTHRSP
ncbi:MAG: hypothetical protein ACE5EF_13800 [Dehalococcoidia bacterium]